MGLERKTGCIFWSFDGSREESSALSAREHVRLVSASQQSSYVRRGWNITGEQVLLSGLDNTGLIYVKPPARHSQRATALAEAVGALALMPMPVPAMSQGQLRLMLILRALLSNPPLLLLDEPFDGLDPAAREQVEQSILLAARHGSTLLVTAHRKKDIPACINKAFLVDKGTVNPVELAAIMRQQEHADHPDEPAESAPASPFPEVAAGGLRAPLSDTPQREFALKDSPALQTAPGAAFPGKKSSQAFPPAEDDFMRRLLARCSPLVELRRVDVFIDRQKALSDITWTVSPGEHWIVSGRNGSGKSTLLRLLYGQEFVAFGGSLTWCGGIRPSQEELRAGVGYVSDRLQDVYEYDVSAEEAVISGLRGSIGLYHEPDDQERRLARLWLERLGLSPLAQRPLHTLSSGTARRVLLARALCKAPPVLLLDEPCSNLDARSRSLFLNALPKLAAQGTTLIYVSHHEQDKSRLFTHELLLENGKIAHSGPRLVS